MEIGLRSRQALTATPPQRTPALRDTLLGARARSDESLPPSAGRARYESPAPCARRIRAPRHGVAGCVRGNRTDRRRAHSHRCWCTRKPHRSRSKGCLARRFPHRHGCGAIPTWRSQRSATGRDRRDPAGGSDGFATLRTQDTGLAPHRDGPTSIIWRPAQWKLSSGHTLRQPPTTHP